MISRRSYLPFSLGLDLFRQVLECRYSLTENISPSLFVKTNQEKGLGSLLTYLLLSQNDPVIK